MKSDTIKVLVSTVTALTGVGGSYWKMEDRVSKIFHTNTKYIITQTYWCITTDVLSIVLLPNDKK